MPSNGMVMPKREGGQRFRALLGVMTIESLTGPQLFLGQALSALTRECRCEARDGIGQVPSHHPHSGDHDHHPHSCDHDHHPHSGDHDSLRGAQMALQCALLNVPLTFACQWPVWYLGPWPRCAITLKFGPVRGPCWLHVIHGLKHSVLSLPASFWAFHGGCRGTVDTAPSAFQVLQLVGLTKARSSQRAPSHPETTGT